MELKIDDGLKALLETGKRNGYLTYAQVKAYVPDESTDSGRLDRILQLLEENGIDLIEESEAEDRGEADPAVARVAEEVQSDLELTFADDGDGRHIDDPVRMYLTQMGEIPLLKREEEIALAKKIEITRKRFRRRVLECDYALRNVVETLKRVHVGDLPFDRTVKISLTENLEKDKILARMPLNLKTLEFLMEQNTSDFERLIDERPHEAEREKIRLRLRERRRKTVTLVEELSIRTQKVQPLMRKLEQISERMNELERQIEDLRGVRQMREERANLQKELTDLKPRRAGEPAPARRLDARTLQGIRGRQARPLRRQLAAGRQHRQEIPQPRFELPRSDPGREHGPDAGRGQVRVSPRLQVQHLCHLVDSSGDHPGHRRPGSHDSHSRSHDRDDEQAA